MSVADYKLFTPLRLGDGLELKNRVVLSPLTRGRAEKASHVPNALNELYYEQRAGAGLIITEATAVSPQGFGWYGAAALYDEAQLDGWKKVVDRVHAKGGKIFVQLWHMGRQAHPSFNDGKPIVSASAIRIENPQIHLRDANGVEAPFELPRALETHEIAGVIDDYRKSAALAKRAGFDGVELHAANGYLVDQFLQSVSNKRTDQYGGSIENRARFLLETVEALKTVWPAHRIGVRLSPNGAGSGMGSPDNYEQFVYAMDKLSSHGLAYLAILDGTSWGTHPWQLVTAFDAKKAFKGNVFANLGYDRGTAEGVLRSGAADAVCFGRPFIANPDLAQRFQNDWPLNEVPPRELWWDATKGEQGYTTFDLYKPSA